MASAPSLVFGQNCSAVRQGVSYLSALASMTMSSSCGTVPALCMSMNWWEGMNERYSMSVARQRGIRHGLG